MNLVRGIVQSVLRTSIHRTGFGIPQITRSIHYTPLCLKQEYKGAKSSFGKVKMASKRKTKKYKLKTHQGAAARWMVMGDGTFKRGQPGRNHFNSKMRSVKRRAKKSKIISNSTQTRRLKKLLPYFKKKYMK